MSCVYLLHFTPAYLRGDGQAQQHYLGATRLPVAERLARHATTRGAALVRAALARGCRVELVAVWPVRTRREAFFLERELKRRRQHALLCRHCHPERVALTDTKVRTTLRLIRRAHRRGTKPCPSTGTTHEK